MVTTERNGWQTLTNGLSPLGASEKLALLFSFEDCGSCAYARMSAEDFSPYEWYLHCNEQTAESAEENSELILTLGRFPNAPAVSHEAKNEAKELLRLHVSEALTRCGYKNVAGSRASSISESTRTYDCELKSFLQWRDGFIIYDFFDSEDEIFDYDEE